MSTNNKLELKKDITDSMTQINICGSLNTINATKFEEFAQDINNNECKNILVDISGLDYISSSGLRAFLKLNKKVRDSKGKMKIVGATDEVREVFEITGLDITLDLV